MILGSNLLLLAAVAVTAVAAFHDLRTGHIPNWVSLGGAAVAPLLHLALGIHDGGLGGGLEAAGFSVVGALACAALPLLLYRLDAMGGGDVKLLIAVGALLRALVGIEAEFYAFIAAALFAPARLAWEGKLLKTLGNTLVLVANPFLPKSRRRELPNEAMTSLRFGPAIFAGVIVAGILHWKLRP